MKILSLPSVLAILIAALGLAGCTLPFGSTKPAGLQVFADPSSSVYLDNKHAGETNYFNDKLKAAEYILKLQPLQNSTQSWETKLHLVSGLTTVVNHKFGATPTESSSYVMELEKIANTKVAEANVVTTPENVIVRIDNQPKGFSPLTHLSLTAGNHELTLSAPGYQTLTFPITPVNGHRLTITAELGKALSLQPTLPATSSPELTASPVPSPSVKPKSSPKPSPTPKPSPSPKVSPSPAVDLDKPYVEILPTPTGWLRVRSEPNGLDASNEVAKIDSGKTFKFIESNQTGWYKIEYESGKEGWIAAQFARLVK